MIMIKNGILFLSFFTVCGCSSFNLTMKSPRQFRQLKDIPICISTQKEVTLVGMNKQKMTVWMDGFYAENYQSINDSLMLFFPTYIAFVPFSNISKITCSGIWDDEIGFISKKEFMCVDSAIGLSRPLGTSILGCVLGFWGGGTLFVKLTDHTALEHSDGWYSYVFGSALAGAVAGAMICHELVKSSHTRKVVNRIREQRKKGNLQE